MTGEMVAVSIGAFKWNSTVIPDGKKIEDLKIYYSEVER